MVSDALDTAVNEIDRCLKAYPECYGGMAEQITKVREAMDNLRNAMDCDHTVSAQESMLRKAGKV
jgi:hypothetical protein